MNETTISSSDAALVAEAMAGSRDAFGTLVQRHQQLVCALAYTGTGSVSASEDIAQETFIAAWKSLPRLRDPENFRGWVCGTARNLAARFRRDRKIVEPLDANLADAGLVSPNEEIMTREEEAMVWATLEQLPENYREPLVLFHRGGLSVREISVALEISEDAAKQRLSRGRAMLQDAVRARVESALTHSRPGKAFSLAVLAGIPAVTTSAQAAGTSFAVAKGAGAVTAKSLLPILGGAFMGIAGAWFGMKCSLDRAESERERRFIVRMGWTTGGAVAFFMAAMTALIFWGTSLLAAGPALWIGLMTATVVLFIGSNFFFSFFNGRVVARIRAQERRKRGIHHSSEPDGSFFEYRSRVEFLGLPLIHIRLGNGALHVARGWIAYGNVAFAPLLAFGGVAVGGIAVGGVSVGIFTMAGLGIGLISMSGLALGGMVIGGLVAGWIAIGGATLGGLAAYGGAAWAGLYGMGRHVIAPHANDAAAKAFFHDHVFMQFAGWIAEHGILVQLGIFLPMFILALWIKRASDKA